MFRILLAISFAFALSFSPSFADAGDGNLSGDSDREIGHATQAQLRLNQEGVEALIEGHASRAVALLTEAYRMGELNILALNLGRAHHSLNQCEKARELLEDVFQLPVVEQPSPEQVDQRAREYLADLEESCNSEEQVSDGGDINEDENEDEAIAAETPAEPSFIETIQPGHYTMAAGAAAALTGLALHLVARSLRSDALRRIEADDSFVDGVNQAITEREIQEIEDRANLLDTFALGSAVAGAAAIGVGAYLLWAPREDQTLPPIGLRFGRDEFGIQWTLRF